MISQGKFLITVDEFSFPLQGAVFFPSDRSPFLGNTCTADV